VRDHLNFIDHVEFLFHPSSVGGGNTPISGGRGFYRWAKQLPNLFEAYNPGEGAEIINRGCEEARSHLMMFIAEQLYPNGIRETLKKSVNSR
jgi:hypothetical protein